MKVLVTGGSGFLGKEIISLLLKENYQVLAISRSAVAFDHPNFYFQSMDLSSCSEDDLLALDFQAVIHTAAKAGIWGSYQDYKKINTHATEQLLKVSAQKQVKAFVYTSTPSVVFGQNAIENGDESMSYPQKFLTHYAQTKMLAEKAVLREKRICCVSLRPHLIWGQGDPHILPRLLAKAKAGRLPQIGNALNKVDITHVKTAAQAHLQCLQKICSHPDSLHGKAYFIGQERPVLLWPFIKDLLATQGIDYQPKRQIGTSLAYALGFLFECIYFFLPRQWEPPMTRFAALQLGTSHYFSHQQAKDDFDFKPALTIEEGLKELRAQKCQ